MAEGDLGDVHPSALTGFKHHGALERVVGGGAGQQAELCGDGLAEFRVWVGSVLTQPPETQLTD